MAELRRTLSDRGLNVQSKMVVTTGSRHEITSGSLWSSLVVLFDPNNMSMAVGFSLLSCIQAEIHVMSFLFPVNGRHLQVPTNPHIGQSPL